MMTEVEYFDLCRDYFSVCSNRSVLEIGPHCGSHTKIISELIPSSLTLIEADAMCAYQLRTFYQVSDVIHDDVFLTLRNPTPADVVICCGVLYHLHSPLYLLELIVNMCSPEHIILDCVNSPKELQVAKEGLNRSGSRQSVHGWKTANFNIIIPYSFIDESMNQLGYSLVKTHQIAGTDIPSKNNCWIGLWKRDAAV